MLEEITSNIYLISARHPNGGIVCIYLIKISDGFVVIDTGLSVHIAEAVIPALKQLATNAQALKWIINTHGHPDHLGGNFALHQLSNADVIIHEKDSHLTRGVSEHITYKQDLIAVMRRLGREQDVQNRTEFLKRYVGDAVAPTRELHEGDSLYLDSTMQLTVIETPGHTQGSITLFDEQRGIAFVGDATQCYGVKSGMLPLFFEMTPYIESLRKLQSLDIAVILPGHPFRLRNALTNSPIIRRGETVSQTLQDSLDAAHIIGDAVDKVSFNHDNESDYIKEVLRQLPQPFDDILQQDGWFPAGASAPIFGHSKLII